MRNILIAFAVFSIVVSPAAAQQRARTTKAAREAPIVFALLEDGTRLEPIVQLEGGRLVPPIDGGQEVSLITIFTKQYFPTGRKYPVVFGGTTVGNASVISSNPTADCSKNTARVRTATTGTNFKGFVMGLATSLPVADTTGFRRKPTATEKAEVEALATKEFAKNKISGALKFHNLTAIDVDNDNTAELVGSYYIPNSKTQRAVLFFIAEKAASGKYELGFSEYRLIKQDEVMSGEISDVDKGIYHELLLDSLDYDGDKAAEIFTHVRSFEGAGFMIYKRAGNKWSRVFEGSNYHCAF